MAAQMDLPGQAQFVDARLQHGMQRAFTNDCHLQVGLVDNGLGKRLDQHFKALAFDQPPHRTEHLAAAWPQRQCLPGLLAAQQRFDEGPRVEGHAQGLYRPPKVVLQGFGKRVRNRCDAQALGGQCPQQADITRRQARLAVEQYLGTHLGNLLQQRQHQPCHADTVEQHDLGLGLGQRLAQAHAQPRPQQAPQVPALERTRRHVPLPGRAEPTAQPAAQQQPVADPGIGPGVGQHLSVNLVDGHVRRTACPHHIDDVHGVSAPLPLKVRWDCDFIEQKW
ncbi:hypothetical protein D3C80_1222300 [compost metagenome]